MFFGVVTFWAANVLVAATFPNYDTSANCQAKLAGSNFSIQNVNKSVSCIQNDGGPWTAVVAFRVNNGNAAGLLTIVEIPGFADQATCLNKADPSNFPIPNGFAATKTTDCIKITSVNPPKAP